MIIIIMTVIIIMLIIIIIYVNITVIKYNMNPTAHSDQIYTQLGH